MQGRTGKNDGLRTDKIRVGVLIDNESVPRWVFESLLEIQSSDYAEIVQIVQNSSTDYNVNGGAGRYRRAFSRILFNLVSRLSKVLVKVKVDPTEPKSIRTITSGARWFSVTPNRSGFVDRFCPQDLEKMAEDGVQVYLRFGFGILKGDILSCCDLGVWSFHHGDSQEYRGVPPAFWEHYHGQPVVGATLQVLCEELDAGKVLYKVHSKTNSIYVRRSACSLYWKSSAVMPRLLRKVHRDGVERFNQFVEAANRERAFYTRPLYSYPNNRQMIRHIAVTIHKFVCHKILQLLFDEQWRLMFFLGEPSEERHSLWRYREICPPPDRFWADPFVLSRDGKHHVFFEELVYSSGKGRIAHVSIDAAGEVSEPSIILDQTYHLSYPFVFEFGGETYMIPESSENKTVDLYRCAKFPRKWEYVKTLIDGIELVDATLVRRDGLWWMFAGQKDYDRVAISHDLALFFTDDLLRGEWTEHPLNPISSDIRNARPAGNVFEQGEFLCRPAQDCRFTYGGAVEIRRIDKLTVDDYQESHVSRLDPNWRSDLVGLHTINQTNEISVVDVLSRRLRLLRYLNFWNRQ